MILDLFIHIIQFYINQNTFLPGFIIRKETNDDAFLTMKAMEERYARENGLIQAVSKGLIHEADNFLPHRFFLKWKKD